MNDRALTLEWIEGEFSVCALGHNALLPPWVINSSGLTAIVRTHDETSVLAPTSVIPHDVPAEQGFCAFRVRGTLEFDLVGVIATLTCALAAEGVPVFVVSTFDTDYVMVKSPDRARAEHALAKVARFISHPVHHA